MLRFSGYVLTLGLVALTGLSACAPTSAPRSASPDAGSRAESQSSRALTMAVRYEPASLASKPLRESGSGVSSTTRLFNAELDIEDGRATVHPYVAESLPQLNSDSWRVFPDGRMETTYRLKPNLTWHDGTPLAADDFAFAWRVYATPSLAVADSPPLTQMEDVVAVDARTITIKWR